MAAKTEGRAGIKKDWDLYNSATWIFDFRLLDENGAAMDATTIAITGSIKAGDAPDAELLVALDAADFTVSNTDTAHVTLKKIVNIDAKKAFYDIKAALPGGIILYPFWGTIDMTKNKTV